MLSFLVKTLVATYHSIKMTWQKGMRRLSPRVYLLTVCHRTMFDSFTRAKGHPCRCLSKVCTRPTPRYLHLFPMTNSSLGLGCFQILKDEDFVTKQMASMTNRRNHQPSTSNHFRFPGSNICGIKYLGLFVHVKPFLLFHWLDAAHCSSFLID
jgi:hypothetical protein